MEDNKSSSNHSSSKIFWINPETETTKLYDDLFHDICSLKTVHKYLKNDDSYKLFVELLASMLTSNEYVLLDRDWSMTELQNLEIDEVALQETYDGARAKFENIEELLNQILANKEWKLGFFTSGTTGRPKYIAHDLTVLARNVKTGDRFANNTWGFCYNPSHFAGIQVFLQAIYNKNTVIDLFHIDYSIAESSLKKYMITHLSATPTYYRSLYPVLHDTYPNIERITFGGEMFDSQIAEQLMQFVPNAKVTNVYASTELGSILAGKGNTLKIPAEFSDRIKISEDGELEVHKSLMGMEVTEDDSWFKTGDLVVQKPDGTLEFVSRKSEMINTGGYKVNPHEVESVILEVLDVNDVIVYGRENKITGKLIAADIKLNGDVSKAREAEIENEIIQYMQSKLQPWKIPRVIKFVSEMDRTRTCKKVRK